MKKIDLTQNKKKIIIIVLAVVLCVCTAAGIISAVKSNNEGESISESTSASSTAASEGQTVIAEPSQEESSAEDQSGSEESPSTSKKSTQDKINENRSKYGVGENNNNIEKTTAANAGGWGQEETPDTDEEITVTVIINSKNAADYGADVPNFLVPSATYTAKQGATVFDALEAVCKENGLSLEYKQKTYIEGIGGLREKDCGGSSGWTYRVNGQLIMKAASKCVLNDGDRVEWIYVTNPNQ